MAGGAQRVASRKGKEGPPAEPMSAAERLAAFAARFEERHRQRQAARQAGVGGGRESEAGRGGRSGAAAAAKGGAKPRTAPEQPQARRSYGRDDEPDVGRRSRKRRSMPAEAATAVAAPGGAKGVRERLGSAHVPSQAAGGVTAVTPRRGGGALGAAGALLSLLLSRAVLGTACFVAGVAYADASPDDRGQRQRALAKAHRAVTRAAARARDAAGPRLRELASALAPLAAEAKHVGGKVVPVLHGAVTQLLPALQLLARLAAQHLRGLHFSLQRRGAHEIEGGPGPEAAGEASTRSGGPKPCDDDAEPATTPRMAASPPAHVSEAVALCASAAEARGSVTKRAAEVVFAASVAPTTPTAPPVPPVAAAPKPPLPFASPSRVPPPASPGAAAAARPALAMPPAARAPLMDAPASPAAVPAPPVPVNAGAESPQEARQRELDAARAYRVAMVEEAAKRLRATEEVTAAWSAKAAAAPVEADAADAEGRKEALAVPAGLSPLRTAAGGASSVAARAAELDGVAAQRAEAQAAVLAARARLAEVVALTTKRSSASAGAPPSGGADPAAMAKLVAASQRTTAAE